MPSQREDLAAVLVPFGRRLMAMETQVLARRALTMWEYVIMSALVDGTAMSQSQLAARIRHDKSRMIGDLERLEAAGLVHREVAHEDRRTNSVTLTTAGRREHRAAQRDIHRAEDDLLRELSGADRAALTAVLQRISSMPGARGPA